MYKTKARSDRYDRRDYLALMNSGIPKTIADGEMMNFDSAEDAGIFFARELDYIKAKTYDRQYPELTALRYIPRTNEVNEGAETYTYYSYDKTGMAKIISDYSTDLPRADVKGKPTTAQIKSVGDSYGYSMQEMKASRFAGKSLDVRKAESARYQIDRTLNTIAWAGDKESGLIGVLSDDNDIPLFTPANNAAASSTKWEDKTYKEILKDVTDMQKYVSKITKDVEKPDTLCLPPDVFLDISTRQIDNTNLTIMKFIFDNAPYLKNIVSAPELQADSTETNPYAAQSKNVAFLFTADAEKLSIEHPLEFIQHPLQYKGLEVIVPCEARTAGACIYYPLSALIAVGI